MNEDKELEEAIKHLKKIAKEYKTYGDLDNPEFEDIMKIPETIETVLQVLERLKQDNYRLDRENQKLFEININSIPKKKIEDKIEEIHKEYIYILSEYGNIDTDITFHIPNKNVRKHLDELTLEIMILQELLEDK